MKNLCLIVAVALVTLCIAMPDAFAQKKKPARCNDGCYSFCAERAKKGVSANIQSCQRACQRNSCS